METDSLKYDFELDMIGENSNSLILREVKPDSKVLEFGCAHGRMTKYLKEQLNCSVYIVEKDAVSGKQASNYADISLTGESGDIENYRWFNLFKSYQVEFDYIIFADVLEHLYDPWKVLAATISFLKPEGRVLISVPNIAHNSVLIDLLNDKFDYRKVGLLDNTHIRFFTQKSLQEMVSQAGFKIDKVLDAKNVVENTEFNNSYKDLPDEVSSFLKQRTNGEIYQYIWSLSKYV